MISFAPPEPELTVIPSSRTMTEEPNLWHFFSSNFRHPLTETIDGGSIPEPYRGLLVHPESMTLVLEEAYQEDLRLRVLYRELSDETLQRQVVLFRPSDGRPAAMGWIWICLKSLSPKVGQAVRKSEKPLGKILEELGVEYSNQPAAYLQALGVSDGAVGEAFGLSTPLDLYGRLNRLLTPSGEIMAVVVEILAPFEPGPDSGRDGSGSQS